MMVFDPPHASPSPLTTYPPRGKTTSKTSQTPKTSHHVHGPQDHQQHELQLRIRQLHLRQVPYYRWLPLRLRRSQRVHLQGLMVLQVNTGWRLRQGVQDVSATTVVVRRVTSLGPPTFKGSAMSLLTTPAPLCRP